MARRSTATTMGKFDAPVFVAFDGQTVHAISSARDAAELLMAWPLKRRDEDYKTMRTVIADTMRGRETPANARSLFHIFARAEGILVVPPLQIDPKD